MKTLVIAIFAIISSEQYDCIATHLQAVNSDIFYNLQSPEIDDMLSHNYAIGHELAVEAAKECGVSF